MDDRWLGLAIRWAAERSQPLPAESHAHTQLKSGTPAEKARASIVVAAQAYGIPQKRTVAKFRLANSCRSLAGEARRAGDNSLARDWLAIACLLYADLSSANSKYEDSLNVCSSQLAQLGVTDWHAHDPLRSSQASATHGQGQETITGANGAHEPEADGGFAPTPVVASAVRSTREDADIVEDSTLSRSPLDDADHLGADVGDLVDVDVDTDLDAAADVAGGVYGPPGPVTTASEYLGMPLLGITTAAAPTRSDGFTDDLEFNLEHDAQLPAYARTWAGTEDIAPVLEAFQAYLCDQIAGAPAAWSHLAATVEADFAALRDLLLDCGVPIVAEEMRLRAKDARALALAHEPNTRLETLIRRRWLVAGLWNHALWTAPYGWPTNEPQVVSDVMGYLTTVQIARRFIDGQRELLLSLCELIVRLAARLEPPDRHPQLLKWVRAVIGTYLVIGGPEPYLPSSSKKHPALVSERLTPTGPGVGIYDTGPEMRDRWAATVLEAWRSGAPPRVSGAAFAIATICGWDQAVVIFALAAVFVIDRDADLEARAFWEHEVLSVIEGASPIRIASNPWKPEGDTAEKAHVVTSEPSGRLRIPSPVLRALAAQLTEAGWSTTIQGELFRGRRIPTYLLLNQFGAFGVLKLDYADRVRREEANFVEYAQHRIHGNYRPSECHTGTYQMFVGNNPEPLQAILTSYVFDEDETPTTLSDWLRVADPDSIDVFLRRFFLRVLRPWLAHVTRRVIDLRMSYPLLRPRPAEHDEHAPTLTARTELPRLQGVEAVERLGFTPGWTERDFAGMRQALLRVPGLQEVDIPEDLINPLWLVSELAEMGDGTLVECLYSLGNPVSAFSTLQTICHGDLHADNVLCTGGGDGGLPRPALIDFETAHEGHVCRDFGRLEAHLLCQNFEWTAASASALVRWLADGLAAGVYAPPRLEASDADLLRVAVGICTLRDTVKKCGQEHWPLDPIEYEFALLAALCPMARYPTLTPMQRGMGLVLAAVVATDLHRRLTG